jgi:MGT family glycosyltransferase
VGSKNKGDRLKIGFVSLPIAGHLNPMIALARRLNQRGHEAIFFGLPDVETRVRAAGVSFVSFGEKEYPIGSVQTTYAPLSRLSGIEVIQYAYEKCSPGLTHAAFDYLPDLLREEGIEAMVIDTAYGFVELVAMSIGIPYAHVWNILPLDFSGATPICLYSWPNNQTPEAHSRNLEGLKPLGAMLGPIAAIAMAFAKKTSLDIDWNDPTFTISKAAILAQTPKEFDFSGAQWPSHFHYTGPFYDPQGRAPIPFAWEKLTEKPLIYASLGTMVNALGHVYQTILEVAEQLSGVQLVLSIGHHIDFSDLGVIPSNVIVVRSAPQMELLQKASLCITHAGLNTALESLALGVPMVAIPIAFDQPGVAARIAEHGVGEFVDLADLTPERLLSLVQTVLNDASYRDRASVFQKAIAHTQGLDMAVDILEQAFPSKR